eukprot:gene5716-4078_t
MCLGKEGVHEALDMVHHPSCVVLHQIDMSARYFLETSGWTEEEGGGGGVLPISNTLRSEEEAREPYEIFRSQNIYISKDEMERKKKNIKNDICKSRSLLYYLRDVYCLICLEMWATQYFCFTLSDRDNKSVIREWIITLSFWKGANEGYIRRKREKSRPCNIFGSVCHAFRVCREEPQRTFFASFPFFLSIATPIKQPTSRDKPGSIAPLQPNAGGTSSLLSSFFPTTRAMAHAAKAVATRAVGKKVFSKDERQYIYDRIHNNMYRWLRQARWKRNMTQPLWIDTHAGCSTDKKGVTYHQTNNNKTEQLVIHTNLLLEASGAALTGKKERSPKIKSQLGPLLKGRLEVLLCLRVGMEDGLKSVEKRRIIN